MLVKHWMNNEVITINSDDSMVDAAKLLKEHAIRMLPVLHKGNLVGVVTDRDIKRASPSDASSLAAHEILYLLANMKIEEVMSKSPITVPFNYTVEEAAEVMLKHKISSLPVLDQKGKIVGVITQSDILKVIISLTGIAKKGIHFAFRLEDRAGSIKEVTDVVRKYRGRIASILTSYERVTEGYRDVFFRIYGMDREKLPQLIAEMKSVATMLYLVDHRENRREIYEG